MTRGLLGVATAVDAGLFAFLVVHATLVRRNVESRHSRVLLSAVAAAAALFVVDALHHMFLPGRLSMDIAANAHPDAAWVAVVVGAGTFGLLGLGLVHHRRVAVRSARAERLAAAIVRERVAWLDVPALTNRELEVIETIGSGHLSNREIGARLFMSPDTAATHVRNIMRKTGVSTREALLLVDISDDANPTIEDRSR